MSSKIETVTQIAASLGFESLVATNHDREDFRDLAVWSVAAALDKAYEAGRTTMLVAGPIDDGGPAFPSADPYVHDGMSLRQHYAGKAMAALVMQGFDIEQTPPIAFETADAMIRASHTPPQKVEQPFDPAKLTRIERDALGHLTSTGLLIRLPADVRAMASACAEFVEPAEEDDGIPF